MAEEQNREKKYIPPGIVGTYMRRIGESDPFVREIQDEPSALRL